MGFMEAIFRWVVFVIEELPEHAKNFWEQSKSYGKPRETTHQKNYLSVMGFEFRFRAEAQTLFKSKAPRKGELVEAVVENCK